MDYVVRLGETLSEICKRHNVSEEDVLKLNRHIEDPGGLRAGQVVTLPPPTVIIEEPQIKRFIPVGAKVVVVKEVKISGRFVPERVIVILIKDGLRGIVVIKFIPGIGWRIVFQRLNIKVPIEILEVGKIFDDDPEIVVCGSCMGDNQGLCFNVLGWHNDQVVEFIDCFDKPIPRGRVSIHEGRLVVGSPAEERRYTWDGNTLVETIL
jgi:hypothetical protein